MRGIQIVTLALAAAININTNCLELGSNQFYNTALLQCSSCPQNQVPTADGFNCECAPGSAKTPETANLPAFECSSCGNGAPSVDFSVCQLCPTLEKDDTQDCACDSAAFEVPLETFEAGGYRDVKLCFSCGSLEKYPGPGANECEDCPATGMTRSTVTYQCECQTSYVTAGDECIESTQSVVIENNFPTDTATNIIYLSHETADDIGTHSLSSSDTFEYYYLKSGYNCQVYRSIQDCQCLANLCVLQLYNQDTTVCRLFNQIGTDRSVINNAKDGGIKEDLPWLYYESDADSILQAEIVQMEVTFDPDSRTRVNELQFKLAKYALDGSFLGFEDLKDQLLLCPHSSEDSKKYREFGTNVIYKCQLDLTKYIDADETVFYDPYLIDDDGTMIDVPVLFRDYRDQNNDSPNTGSSSGDWRLTRRFFLYDNVSGKEGTFAYINDEETTVLRYARDIRLQVELMKDEDHRIYIPLLIFEYRSRFSNYIRNSDSEDKIQFESEYIMDTDNFWEVATGVFIGNHILTFFIWIARIYIWTKNNPTKYSAETYIPWICGNGFTLLLQTWAFMNFWYLYIMCAYWFIFYKMQYYTYILMPSLEDDQNYYEFIVLFSIVFACQIIVMLDLIRRQCSTDYLLIDWETPNRIVINPQYVKVNEFEQLGITETPLVSKIGVSAWRSLFVANELNELQSIRYISIEFTLLLILFFLHGLGWDNLAASQPNMEVEKSEGAESPINPVLKFALTTTLFIVIGYGQYIIRKVLSIWIPTPIQMFTDICSVANISVLIFDQSLHGYYIHGISPTGSADLNVDELKRALEQEGQGKSRGRGIIPEDPTGLQCFELYVPFNMRRTYDFLATNPVDEEMNEYKTNQRLSQASKLQFYTPNLPDSLDYERLEQVRGELNNRLKTYISTVVMDEKTHILDKTYLQRFLNMPPTDLAVLQGSPYFYRDPGMGFERVFLMGAEFSYLLTELLVFALLDYTVQNHYISALVTYVWSKFVLILRQKFGEWNLSRKTLTDSRFLIQLIFYLTFQNLGLILNQYPNKPGVLLLSLEVA